MATPLRALGGRQPSRKGEGLWGTDRVGTPEPCLRYGSCSVVLFAVVGARTVVVVGVSDALTLVLE
jgi:hypothetical protein